MNYYFSLRQHVQISFCHLLWPLEDTQSEKNQSGMIKFLPVDWGQLWWEKSKDNWCHVSSLSLWCVCLWGMVSPEQCAQIYSAGVAACLSCQSAKSGVSTLCSVPVTCRRFKPHLCPLHPLSHCPAFSPLEPPPSPALLTTFLLCHFVNKPRAETTCVSAFDSTEPPVCWFANLYILFLFINYWLMFMFQRQRKTKVDSKIWLALIFPLKWAGWLTIHFLYIIFQTLYIFVHFHKKHISLERNN